MYMRDFDLRELELQLYGFEAGLSAAGIVWEHDWFNRAFSDFLCCTSELSCSQGWAIALLQKYGQGESSFNRFLSLLEDAASKGPGSVPAT